MPSPPLLPLSPSIVLIKSIKLSISKIKFSASVNIQQQC